MKNVKVSLAGADSDYEDVGGQGNGKKWDFKVNPELECVIVSRKRLQGRNGDYDMYNVLHRHSKEEYVIFCNKVLEDRMKNIPIFSAIKISFLGVEPVKKYHKFSVGFDKKFIYNPTEWVREETGYIEPAATDYAQPQQQVVTTKPGGAELEDAPF